LRESRIEGERRVKIRANGIEQYYTVEGAGPWLVMSHSLACDSAMWGEQAELLARRFKVLRYDTRGHGQSDAPAGPYTLDMLADARPTGSESRWAE
jgi:3-oxoadipate enol-lactonase